MEHVRLKEDLENKINKLDEKVKSYESKLTSLKTVGLVCVSDVQKDQAYQNELSELKNRKRVLSHGLKEVDNSIHFDSFVEAKYTQLHPKIQAWWSVAKGKLVVAGEEISRAMATARRDPDVGRVLGAIDYVRELLDRGLAVVKKYYLQYIHPLGRY